MDDQIKELREDIAKLRERVAVLEARPAPVPVDLIRFGGPATAGGAINLAPTHRTLCMKPEHCGECDRLAALRPYQGATDE